MKKTLAALALILLILSLCACGKEAVILPESMEEAAGDVIADAPSQEAVELPQHICLPQEGEAVLQENGEIPKNTRIRYQSASCHTLEGNPYVLAIFLDDDESSWTEEEVCAYWYNLIVPGQEFIESNAAQWGVELDFQRGYYATYGHPDRPVKYDGVILRYDESREYSKDILDQAAVSLGYESKEDMHRRLKEFSGQDQVAYLIMLNKGGRSYSISYYNNGEDPRKSEKRDSLLEYCVIYTGFTDDSADSASDTIAHEMLHIFGAEDYYMPENRKTLAQKYYPKDIMLCAMSDLVYFDLGEFTAYCVGWTDEEPAVCAEPGWWS